MHLKYWWQANCQKNSYDTSGVLRNLADILKFSKSLLNLDVPIKRLHSWHFGKQQKECEIFKYLSEFQNFSKKPFRKLFALKILSER